MTSRREPYKAILVEGALAMGMSLGASQVVRLLPALSDSQGWDLDAEVLDRIVDVTSFAGVGLAVIVLVATVLKLFMESMSEVPARSLTAVDRTSDPAVVPRVQERIAAVHQAHDDLRAEWGRYALNPQDWYLNKPVLRDITGTVAPTVAYNRAMEALDEVCASLHPDMSERELAAAEECADAAWKRWYEANDHAAAVGLDDRSPTERAALQRLANLVERLTLSSANDPELPMVKREIEACLEKISTVTANIADITAIPAIAAAGHYLSLDKSPSAI
ncbi:hypothetical protein [Gordonia malaquae]|uniref:hypothetical protein n=1 Tax=Gordonia malaquae TaxID=410332 RepID=UPI0030160358